jgi:putative ABC transport system permease protein
MRDDPTPVVRPSTPEWLALLLAHAQATGVDLPRRTCEELATHLEDVYLGARERGLDDQAARGEVMQALEQSGLPALSSDPRPDVRAPYVGLADAAAATTSSGGLALVPALQTAMRQLRLHPLFAITVVLVLGIGTGAATAVYTIVDAVILRPLPYRAPDRLVRLWDTNSEKGLGRDPISPVTFLDYRALPIFEDAAVWWRPDVNLVDPGLEPVRVKTIETSGNLFSVLGVGTQQGQGFPAGGPLHAGDLIAVISDRLWRTRYGADPGVIGRQLSLNDTAYTVVGIMPPGFHFPDDVDVWQRLQWDLARHSRGAHFMEAVGRLQADASVPAARAAADALAGRLGREFESTNRGWAFAVVPLLEDQLGYYRPALYVSFGAVGLLFLIGCLNVASLLLTRALSRGRDFAVRLAIGATPRQVVAQLLAESFVLSVAGAIAGILVALVALPLAVAFSPVTVPRLADAAVNGRVMALAGLLVVGMTVLFGLVPALVLVRHNVGPDLKGGERGNSRGSRRLHQGLVVAEVGLACALLVSSALLVRTVGQMTRVPLGVSADHVSLATIQLPVASGRASAWQAMAVQHERILDRVREQPGVTAAGSANFLPFEHGWRGPLDVVAAVPMRPDDRPQVQYHSVSDGYFETMGARLLAGRAFSRTDRPDTDPVVIVNETLARRYFPGQSAVGRELVATMQQVGPLGTNLSWPPTRGGTRAAPRMRIVGVVADVRNTALGVPIEPAVYHTTRQFPFSAVTLAVAARDGATAAAAVRAALREVSPHTPVGAVETWQDRLARRTAEPRLLMTVLVGFGALAALLAALGVYALFSWSVSLQRRSLAIRLTLGARPSSIGAMVLRRSVTLIALGVATGLIGMVMVRGALRTVVYGIAPSDPTSMVVAAGLLLVVALAATLPPAWRAMRVDPVGGLRAE